MSALGPGGPPTTPGVPLAVPPGPDLGAMLRQAQELSRQLAEAQAQVDRETVEGTAGGGAVRVTLNGAMDFTSVRIDPAAVEPDDPSLLEDLVLAALGDAMAKVRQLRGQVLGVVAPDLMGGVPGLQSVPAAPAEDPAPPAPGPATG